jgi:hypothetical protein
MEFAIQTGSAGSRKAQYLSCQSRIYRLMHAWNVMRTWNVKFLSRSGSENGSKLLIMTVDKASKRSRCIFTSLSSYKVHNVTFREAEGGESVAKVCAGNRNLYK